MKPLYIIVHESCITASMKVARMESTRLRIKRILDNLQIIKSEESYIDFRDNPEQMTYPCPDRRREIIICRAYRRLCVQIHYDLLTRMGYNARILEEATLS